MSHTTDSAIPTRIASINDTVVGHKLRVAGKILCYDPLSARALLLDKDIALLVDVSLCLDRWSSSWIRERLAPVMIIGHLEAVDTRLPLPELPDHALPPLVNQDIYLQALLVIATPTLDLTLWNQSIQEGEETLT
ncbi:hypothetical protein HGRIS_004942 [Hohenbuehelia grisea]|uniref:Uncharacterized protein n=1 Tax=Hohenbuehelia grisea TaxID=104357 RepID=A0ABR3JED5_9AGAR